MSDYMMTPKKLEDPKLDKVRKEIMRRFRIATRSGMDGKPYTHDELTIQVTLSGIADYIDSLDSEYDEYLRLKKKFENV